MTPLLTDEEIDTICIEVRSLAGYEVCRAIEQAVMRKAYQRAADAIYNIDLHAHDAILKLMEE